MTPRQSGLHVVPCRGTAAFGLPWKVYEQGNDLAYCLTRREALRVGRALAKEGRTSLRIHGVSGKILEERSYGNESRRPG